jgi:predicted HicB family RNase H-like nuclease
MKYKEYVAQVTFDSDAKIFHGEVMGLQDVVTFQGTTMKELEKAFKDSVDDYLKWCEERGEMPENDSRAVYTEQSKSSKCTLRAPPLRPYPTTTTTT